MRCEYIVLEQYEQGKIELPRGQNQTDIIRQHINRIKAEISTEQQLASLEGKIDALRATLPNAIRNEVGKVQSEVNNLLEKFASLRHDVVQINEAVATTLEKRLPPPQEQPAPSPSSDPGKMFG